MIERDGLGRFLPGAPALLRFIAKCRFEPETGCVIWTGGKTQGRGHHAPYGAFKFEGRRWFAHRWSAKFIHGLDIDELQVDHCCPHIAKPNTLCVEHVQALTLLQNRDLQTRRRFIHLQVGLISYEDMYGPDVDLDDFIPFDIHPAPLWLGLQETPRDHPAAADDCPF